MSKPSALGFPRNSSPLRTLVLPFTINGSSILSVLQAKKILESSLPSLSLSNSTALKRHQQIIPSASSRVYHQLGRREPTDRPARGPPSLSGRLPLAGRCLPRCIFLGRPDVAAHASTLPAQPPRCTPASGPPRRTPASDLRARFPPRPSLPPALSLSLLRRPASPHVPIPPSGMQRSTAPCSGHAPAPLPSSSVTRGELLPLCALAPSWS